MSAAQGMDLLQDLTSLEPGIILNAAFCARHRQHCAPSHQLEKECDKARVIVATLPFVFIARYTVNEKDMLWRSGKS